MLQHDGHDGHVVVVVGAGMAAAAALVAAGHDRAVDRSALRAPPGRLLPVRTPLYRRPAPEGRLHWASTETADRYAGHIVGAHAAAERAVTASLTEDEANSCSR
jgi:hypothetical protein